MATFLERAVCSVYCILCVLYVICLFAISLISCMSIQLLDTRTIYSTVFVLHVYNKRLGIRLAGHPANKNKCLVLLFFEEYI